MRGGICSRAAQDTDEKVCRSSDASLAQQSQQHELNKEWCSADDGTLKVVLASERVKSWLVDHENPAGRSESSQHYNWTNRCARNPPWCTSASPSRLDDHAKGCERHLELWR